MGERLLCPHLALRLRRDGIRMRTLTLWLLLVGAAAGTAFSSTIISATAGTSSGGPFWWGQDFNTPTGGPWNDITFNFYSGPGATNPEAAGTAFSAKRNLFRHAGGAPAAQRLGFSIRRARSLAEIIYSIAHCCCSPIHTIGYMRTPHSHYPVGRITVESLISRQLQPANYFRPRIRLIF